MTIPYGRQSIDQADIDAVVEALTSDFITQGPLVPAFETAVAARVAAKHAVAANSATSALHIAVMALGLGPGDILWTSPITFVASANVAIYCGAEVDFVDIDPNSFNMCPQALAEKLEQAAAQNRLPKIIIPVHMAGQSAPMQQIAELARQYDIAIVEDASHAIGAAYEDQPVGACPYSDIAVFSFHPVKIITTAEGGMATTNNADLARRMEMLRSHGITRNTEELQNPSDGGWYYEMQALGWNYRMTELQAALGVSQMRKLDGFINARNKLARRYDTLLDTDRLDVPVIADGTVSSFHLYIIRLKQSAQHEAVFRHMRAADIGVNLHYIPVHRQPYYQKLGFRQGDFPKSEDYYSRAISIPLFADLTESEQDRVVEVLHEAVS